MLKTNLDILKYIYENLGPIIRKVTDETYKTTPFTESLLGAMTWRETGFLFPKYVNRGLSITELAKKMIGDHGHGYGFIQIDDRSYPDWLATAKLENIESFYCKAIEVLEEKRRSIEKAGFTKEKLGEDAWMMAIVCAYNCGQGNVIKSLRNGQDPNRRTFSGDYGKEVMKMRYIYWDKFVAPNSASAEEHLSAVDTGEAFASAELEPVANETITDIENITSA